MRHFTRLLRSSTTLFLVAIKVFIKEKNRIIAVFLVVLLFISTLCSCEIEVEGAQPQTVLSSCTAVRWNESASGEDEYSSSSLSSEDLYTGTEGLRLKKLVMQVRTSDYEGYEMVQCDFNVTSNVAAKLTVECFASINGGELIECGTVNLELSADEPTKVGLDIYTGEVIKKGSTLEYEIRFSSTLPFADGVPDDAALGTFVDFATWAAIEYKIDGMLFYGAQTTVT